MYISLCIYIRTYTYIYIPKNTHTHTPTHPNILTNTYKKGNNPIQMKGNKLYQSLYIPPTLNRTHSNNAHVVNKNSNII